MLKLLPKAHVSPETGGDPKVWHNQSTPAWLPTTKPLLTTKKPSGPFVHTAPWNLALGSFTWLWNIFCTWTSLYVWSKSLWGKQVLEDPQTFPEASRESSLLRWKMRFPGRAGEWKLLLAKISCPNAKQNLSALHSNTTDRHRLVCEQWDPTCSTIKSQMCSLWAQTHEEHWHLLSPQCQLYLYIRSISISGSSWCSFILTVSDRIIWRLNTKSWTCEK